MIKVTVIFKTATLGMSFYSKEDRLEIQGKIREARGRNVKDIVLRTSNGSTIFDVHEIAGVLFEEVED